MESEITLEQLTKILPKRMTRNVNQEMADTINGRIFDPVIKEQFKENIIGYSTILKQTTHSMSQYVSAVTFITFKSCGDTNANAYLKTFPDRYNRLIESGANEKVISTYVCIYNKSKIVNLIREQSLIAPCILNADLYQQALNTQAKLMLNKDVSPTVRSHAADSLLTHLKLPETAKFSIDLSFKENDVIEELRKSTLALVEQQKLSLETGRSTPKQIAENPICVEGVFEEH